MAQFFLWEPSKITDSLALKIGCSFFKKIGRYHRVRRKCESLYIRRKFRKPLNMISFLTGFYQKFHEQNFKTFETMCQISREKKKIYITLLHVGMGKGWSMLKYCQSLVTIHVSHFHKFLTNKFVSKLGNPTIYDELGKKIKFIPLPVRSACVCGRNLT